MTAAITFTNLVKTYGKQQAVSDLSIEVQTKGSHYRIFRSKRRR
jgi:ABC-type multidrug transport system ATPase subunit